LTPERVKWLETAELAMETCFLPRALPAPNMACGIGKPILLISQEPSVAEKVSA